MESRMPRNIQITKKEISGITSTSNARHDEPFVVENDASGAVLRQ